MSETSHLTLSKGKSSVSPKCGDCFKSSLSHRALDLSFAWEHLLRGYAYLSL